MNVFKFKSGLNWKPRNWIEHIKMFFRRLKYAYQRATKGYCDRDIWDLYEYYTEVMLNSLKQLKEEKHGYPGRAPFDTEEKWDKYLDKIISELQVVQDYNDYCNGDPGDWGGAEEATKRYKEAQEHLKQALTMISNCYFSLWD